MEALIAYSILQIIFLVYTKIQNYSKNYVTCRRIKTADIKITYPKKV